MIVTRKALIPIIVSLIAATGGAVWYFSSREKPQAINSFGTEENPSDELELENTAIAANTNTSIADTASANTSVINTNSAAGKTCTPTKQVTEGPYYKSGSPERKEIRDSGTYGFTITLSGQVFDTNCQPIAGAVLDFWQADGQGEYDNSGYKLRGHQTTEANGSYLLYTVIPGVYPGRTEHIHVKVRRPNGQFITTQLFFPAVTQNDTDSLYDKSLLVTQYADEFLATYDFVLQ